MTDDRSGQIVFVADHDARIDEIRLQAQGGCEVRFESVEVYRPTDLEEGEEEAYASRRHPARLVLGGVTSFSSEGHWEKRNLLMDGDVLDPTGARLSWERLLTEQPIRRVELMYWGGKVVIDATSARLELEGEGEEFERCSGPL